jgi:2-succinyl-5-enolpyruvyl-6-hydroxy-3-cyclohexene-1-carboxylate synthase
MNLNQLWSKNVVERLVSLGINHFYLSPGLRNTPLIWAIQNCERAKYYLGFDERGQSYRALGAAKVLQKPVVLVCTSGSALANFFPAVIEAFHSRVPLLIISADRPVDLMWAQDNQTCDQERFFGTYCEEHLALPSPSEQVTLSALDLKLHHFFTQLTDRPAHLNMRFREPLLATLEDAEEFSLPKRIISSATTRVLEISEKAEITEKIKNSKRPLLVMGELFTVPNLSELSIPLVSDVTSPHQSHFPSFDCSFTQNWVKDYNPDLVIHLGGKITSKYYYLWKQKEKVETITLKNNLDLDDPSFALQHLFVSELGEDYEFVLGLLPKNLDYIAPTWNFDLKGKLNQFNFVEWYIKNSAPETRHVIANSSVVRSFDLFSTHLKYSYFNRGTSGIEGFMAMSLGVHEISKTPTQLVVGDVAFLHDLSSLALFHQNLEAKNLRIYLINNYGGAIFKSLPIARFGDVLKIISTPHELNFQKVAEQFSFSYFRVETLDHLKSLPTPSGLELIELVIDADENENVLKSIKSYVSEIS